MFDVYIRRRRGRAEDRECSVGAEIGHKSPGGCGSDPSSKLDKNDHPEKCLQLPPNESFLVLLPLPPFQRANPPRKKRKRRQPSLMTPLPPPLLSPQLKISKSSRTVSQTRVHLPRLRRPQLTRYLCKSSPPLQNLSPSVSKLPKRKWYVYQNSAPMFVAWIIHPLVQKRIKEYDTPEAELNPDQIRSIASLPTLEAAVKELEEVKKSIEVRRPT